MIETTGPATRRRNREKDDLQIGRDTDSQAKAKRARKPLQLQERLKIIAYWEANQDKSMTKIGKKFNVPRSTVYGIINSRDNLKRFANARPRAGLTLERYTMAKPRLHILEELLVAWILDLGSRGVYVANKKITAQAYEIHRMLSDMLVNPLPPCTYSSGWHQKFKKRHKGIFETIQGTDSTADVNDSWSNPELIKGIFRPGIDDIYTCGVASMHLNILPPRVYNGSCQDSSSRMRHRQTTCEIEGYEETEIYGSAEDFTISTIERWLNGFNRTLKNRRILMLVDQATWNLFRTLEASSGNIVFVKVAMALDSSLPMAVELVKKFKQNYYYSLLEAYGRRGTQAQEPSLEDQLRLVPMTWLNIQGYTVQHAFKSLLEFIRQQQQHFRELAPFKPSPTLDYIAERLSSLGTSRSDKLQDNDGHESRLSQAVKDAYPGAPETILQHYLAQGSDIGPSSLLRAKIQEMRHHQDFASCFGTSSSSQ
ncbi:hypothetical protein BGZ65_004142, partial [Modicella reniformis]